MPSIAESPAATAGSWRRLTNLLFQLPATLTSGTEHMEIDKDR